MDLNVEQVGAVTGWEPPVGQVLSPGFRAVMETLADTCGSPTLGSACISRCRKFINKLEDKGYCIAKYTGK